MAGRESQNQGSIPMAPSQCQSPGITPRAVAMEKSDDREKTCWRKELDANLKRLHSLLFGGEAAAERGDFPAAHVLGLQLLGFLESRNLTDIDEALIRPIRREAMSNLDAARHSLVADSDR